MTFPPWLVLALAVSLVFALLYQLFSRRFGWRVLAYWLILFICFVAGEIFAESVSWSAGRVGDLRIIPDLLASILGMLALWFLGL